MQTLQFWLVIVDRKVADWAHAEFSSLKMRLARCAVLTSWWSLLELKNKGVHWILVDLVQTTYYVLDKKLRQEFGCCGILGNPHIYETSVSSQARTRQPIYQHHASTYCSLMSPPLKQRIAPWLLMPLLETWVCRSAGSECQHRSCKLFLWWCKVIELELAVVLNAEAARDSFSFVTFRDEIPRNNLPLDIIFSRSVS